MCRTDPLKRTEPGILDGPLILYALHAALNMTFRGTCCKNIIFISSKLCIFLYSVLLKELLS